MTKQELFDKAALGIIAQRGPSMGTYTGVSSEVNMGCLYRSKDGGKCGIGHLIPDELYNRDMEGCDVNRLMEKFADVGSHVLPDDCSRAHGITYLSALQSTHDRNGLDDSDAATFMQRWQYDMKNLGKYYDLDTKVLDILS